jgi:CubicO group peptidase (beta-lactamase class C family)
MFAAIVLAAMTTTASALDAISAYAPRAMQEQGTPGLSVAITDRTQTLAVLTLGYANRDARAPVTPATRFAIGSITKSMTALALMQLVDEGKLDVNAPVKRYLPWFAIRSLGGPILVRELLSHTAGLPDDFAVTPGGTYNVWALRETTTLFAPDTAWAYSNNGFETAGDILAQLDRRSWADAVEARVMTPLGMTGSSPFFTPQELAAAATPYQFRDSDRPASLDPPLVASPAMDFVDAAGSVLSTPEDMARYMRFYLNGGVTPDGRRLISQRAFDEMTHAARFANGKPAGSAGTTLAEAPSFYRQYGFGLSVFDENGDHLIGHTGGISGYTACMQMNLTRGFGVIAFANLVEAPLHPCAIALYAMRALRAASASEAIPSPPAPPDRAGVAHAAQYDGLYRAPSGATIEVASSGDRAFMVDGATKIALYPRGSDAFWVDDPRYATFLLAFSRNAGGLVDEVNYGSRWYVNARYRGPLSAAVPPRWQQLVGRYENTFWGAPFIVRVMVVKNRLTFDGTDALETRNDGTFSIGPSMVRFDAFAGNRAQRLSIDGLQLYRVDLP